MKEVKVHSCSFFHPFAFPTPNQPGYILFTPWLLNLTNVYLWFTQENSTGPRVWDPGLELCSSADLHCELRPKSFLLNLNFIFCGSSVSYVSMVSSASMILVFLCQVFMSMIFHSECVLSTAASETEKLKILWVDIWTLPGNLCCFTQFYILIIYT